MNLVFGKVTRLLLSNEMQRKPANDQSDGLMAWFELNRERDKFKGKNDKCKQFWSKL
jgi:hypothetical protein